MLFSINSNEQRFHKSAVLKLILMNKFSGVYNILALKASINILYLVESYKNIHRDNNIL